MASRYDQKQKNDSVPDYLRDDVDNVPPAAVKQRPAAPPKSPLAQVEQAQTQKPTSVAVKPLPNVEKPIPHSLEAEEAVIGSLLLDRDTVIRVAPYIKPTDFFSSGCAAVYDAVLELYATSTPADLTNVRDTLKRNGRLGDTEGQVKSSYLWNLMRATSTPVHAEYYAKMVLRYSTMRKMISVGTHITALGFDEKLESSQMFEKASSMLQIIQPHVGAEYAMTHAQSLTSFMERQANLEAEKLAEAEARKNDPLGQAKTRATQMLSFGWADFDGSDGYNSDYGYYKETKLFMPFGTVVSILGRPGSNKSTAAEMILEYNAAIGVEGLYFHFEHSHIQMLIRRMTRWSGINNIDIRRGYNGKEIHDATDQLARWKAGITYIDSCDWTANQVANEIKTRMNGPYPPKLVVVDYMQLMHSEAKDQSEVSIGLSKSIRILKAVATKLNIVVILVSQVNKESYKGLSLGSASGTKVFEDQTNLLLGVEPDEEIKGIRHVRPLKFNDVNIEDMDFEAFTLVKGRYMLLSEGDKEKGWRAFLETKKNPLNPRHVSEGSFEEQLKKARAVNG